MEPDFEKSITPMRCRKCRHVILQHPEGGCHVPVEDSHGEPFTSAPTPGVLGSTLETDHCQSEVWYVPEHGMPGWIREQLDKGQWVKGKLTCPKCEGRIGSYNFVTGFKCPCGSRVVPPIHIVRSKVDFTRPLKIVTNQSTTGQVSHPHLTFSDP